MNTSAVIPFSFETQDVRAVTVDGEPWFVAKDVCNVLGYQNTSKTISDHLDEDEYSNVSLGNTGPGNPNVNIISESGLYTLVIRSNKPQAKLFRKWVTSVVLPSIRKTGEYVAPEFEGNKYSVYRHQHRTTTAPKGLDIRYTLDLTKIILRPAKNTLALLQRLTGVDVSDLAEQVADIRPGHETASSIQGFLNDCTVSVADGSTGYPLLYSRYVVWCMDRQLLPGQIASNRILASTLRTLGYSVEKKGGQLVVYGLAVSVEVAA